MREYTKSREILVKQETQEALHGIRLYRKFLILSKRQLMNVVDRLNELLKLSA